MELALCQEKEDTKLFIQGIKWTEIINALKEEEVKVDYYELGYDNDFTNNPDDKHVISYFSISNHHTLFGEIINMIVSLNPLKEVETIKLEKLKAGFPELVEHGLSLDEIWERFFRTNVEREMPYELRLGNDAFYLECYASLESYLLTFHSKDKLISFIENANLILSGQTSTDFILAAKEEKPYATDGFKAVFEEAGKVGQIDTFQNLRINPKQEPSKDYPIELVVTSRHNNFKLLTEGLSLKDLSDIFKNETVFVSSLGIDTNDLYTIESDDFKMGELWYEFNPQKIHFGHLMEKITSLNLPENFREPQLLNIGNASFELDSRWSWYPPMYTLTFWQEDVMLKFLNAFEPFVTKEVVDAMKKAVQKGKDYCTEGCGSDFEKARNMYRTESMIGLMERVWIINEEQELAKALKITTQNEHAQPGDEVVNEEEPVKLTDNEKKIYGSSYGRPWNRPYPYFLVYYRLRADRMNCFDGDGKIYGFDGETVIKCLISYFSQPEIKEDMETLLMYYKKRFHQSMVKEQL